MFNSEEFILNNNICYLLILFSFNQQGNVKIKKFQCCSMYDDWKFFLSHKAPIPLGKDTREQMINLRRVLFTKSHFHFNILNYVFLVGHLGPISTVTL